jgi:hypothetical protein
MDDVGQGWLPIVEELKKIKVRIGWIKMDDSG